MLVNNAESAREFAASWINEASQGRAARHIRWAIDDLRRGQALDDSRRRPRDRGVEEAIAVLETALQEVAS